MIPTLPSPYRCIVLDSSVLLGGNSPRIVAGAALGYYRACWSPWIVGEYVRNRIEWAVARSGGNQAGDFERKSRLALARSRVNGAIDYLSRILVNVDYHAAPDVDLLWLSDPDDHPIMLTVLAAGAEVLVTDNTRDFPSGQRRHDVLLLDSDRFLSILSEDLPESEAAIREYLGRG